MATSPGSGSDPDGTQTADPVITFARLTEIPLALVLDLLNESRNARHLPLAGAFDADAAADWVRAKDGQWDANGYGPWAVMIDGRFAGWGGFQREENGADFALVLSPPYWGHGAAVTRAALDQGFAEFGFDDVIIALPYSRSPTRVVARFGFRSDGDVSYGGTTFRQYRLSRQDWANVTRGAGEEV